jgi:radical SAM superfamily enzyme YgiQ (UPF0313 family)
MIEEAIKQYVRQEFEIVAEEFKKNLTDLNKPMTKRQIAKFLELSESTIEKAMRDEVNPIPFILPSADPRFIPCRVLEWAEKRKKCVNSVELSTPFSP